MLTYLDLSWTFCLMSTKLAAEISLSRYSERVSVAVSKSFWFSWNGVRIRSKFYKNKTENLPRKSRIGCFCASNRQIHKCTWAYVCIHIKCRQPFSRIGSQSRTYCAVAFPPFSPAIQTIFLAQNWYEFCREFKKYEL